MYRGVTFLKQWLNINWGWQFVSLPTYELDFCFAEFEGEMVSLNTSTSNNFNGVSNFLIFYVSKEIYLISTSFGHCSQRQSIWNSKPAHFPQEVSEKVSVGRGCLAKFLHAQVLFLLHPICQSCLTIVSTSALHHTLLSPQQPLRVTHLSLLSKQSRTQVLARFPIIARWNGRIQASQIEESKSIFRLPQHTSPGPETPVRQEWRPCISHVNIEKRHPIPPHPSYKRQIHHGFLKNSPFLKLGMESKEPKVGTQVPCHVRSSNKKASISWKYREIKSQIIFWWPRFI